MKAKKTVLPSREALREIILSTLKTKDTWERKPLIHAAIGQCGYTAEELKDTSCESISTALKSFSGIVINELIAEKAIAVNDDGLLMRADTKIDKKEIEETFIKKYLAEDEQKDNTSNGKKNLLKSVIGDIIKKKEDDIKKAVDHIAFIDAELQKNENVMNRVIKTAETKYPDSPLGQGLAHLRRQYLNHKKNKLNAETYKKELHKGIIECIFHAGGEFFERMSLILLKKAYGDRVISEKLSGGPDDNGIDAKLVLRDELGFEENVLVQAKTKKRANAVIALCDIREFAGVMAAEKADKGILISNSTFHRETEKFAAKIRNLKLINKKILLSLMEQHRVGLVEDSDGILMVDESLFLS